LEDVESAVTGKDDLRKQVIEDNNIQDEELCISVAWGWMFHGLTPSEIGINQEVYVYYYFGSDNSQSKAWESITGDSRAVAASNGRAS
jgi:hypothetical protein